MNAGSSRSHCVVTLVVERHYPDGRAEFGKLCLVVRCAAALYAVLLAAGTACAATGPSPPAAAPQRRPCVPARLQDLAGSERKDKTGAVGTTAAEGSQINKSLR